MNRYEEYKDTGIAWLPRIPAHWEERKFKYCFVERSEKNHPDEEMLCATQSHGVIPQSMYQNRVVVVNKGFEGLKLVNVGDFVISLRSFEGGIEYAYYQGIISAAYTILTPVEKQCTEYFKRLFKSQPFIQLLQTCVTGIREGQNINYPLLGRKQIPIPPLAEQEKIVRFLEDKTSKIDALLEKKGEQIKLLNELKESEIANIITRGLNPDVKMKDSGIFWQPRVPEHWNVTRLKYVITKLSRERRPEDELLVCSNSGEVRKRGESKLGLVANSDEIYQGVRKGDLLIHGMDTWHGAIAISMYNGMCTPVVHVCDSTQEKEYIALYLRNMAAQKIFKLISNGVRQNTSDFRSWDKLARIPIPVPPITEQRDIIAYVSDKCNKVNSLITELEGEIEYLKEYKQKLIADCVTGQIDVRNM